MCLSQEVVSRSTQLLTGSARTVDGFILSERYLWRVRKCEIRQEVRRFRRGTES